MPQQRKEISYTYNLNGRTVLPEPGTTPALHRRVSVSGASYTVREIFWHTADRATVILK